MLELAGNINICTSDLFLVVGDGIHMTTSTSGPRMVHYLSKYVVACKFHVILKTNGQVLPAILSRRGCVQIFISAKISSSLLYHYPLVEVSPGDWGVHHGDLTPKVLTYKLIQAVFGGTVYVVKVHLDTSNAFQSYAMVVDGDTGKVSLILINWFSSIYLACT
jgi:hypothetical protein